MHIFFFTSVSMATTGFSILQLFFLFEIVHFGTAIPKRPNPECLCLCNIVIDMA